MITHLINNCNYSQEDVKQLNADDYKRICTCNVPYPSNCIALHSRAQCCFPHEPAHWSTIIGYVTLRYLKISWDTIYYTHIYTHNTVYIFWIVWANDIYIHAQLQAHWHNLVFNILTFILESWLEIIQVHVC